VNSIAVWANKAQSVISLWYLQSNWGAAF